MKTNTLHIAKDVFSEIVTRFPWLQYIEDQEAPVELSITIPVQPGIKQKIWLSFQNHDELHFSVGHFWLEWFPCTNPDQVKEYVAVICGFIAGESRIIEYYRGNRCVKAQLQLPDQGE